MRVRCRYLRFGLVRIGDESGRDREVVKVGTSASRTLVSLLPGQPSILSQ